MDHKAFYKLKNVYIGFNEIGKVWVSSSKWNGLNSRKWVRIANDLRKLIQLYIFPYFYFHNAFMAIVPSHICQSIRNQPVYIMTHYVYKILIV